MRNSYLHTRIALLLGSLVAGLSLLLVALWLHASRLAIHEEVEAAGRVSEQMLQVLTADATAPAALVERVRPLGRVRAHELVVRAADGSLLYRSPAPVYKAGRSAPAWFAALLDPQLPVRELTVGELRLHLLPDASRAQLDAWDELRWLGLLLAVLIASCGLLVRHALLRAMRPLDQVMAALDSMGHGHFSTRLPIFPSSELGRLARAFNGMADRLKQAVDENVQLETERELAARLQQRLAAERSEIARELHDELAQGVTAVRALAGAIVQRTAEQPQIRAQAAHVVAAAGEMQQGVRRILNRLHTPAAEADQLFDEMLQRWRQRHPEIVLDCRRSTSLAACSDEVAGTVVRAAQEGLTNVVRHAAARRVELTVLDEAGTLALRLSDDGQGTGDGRHAGSGLGLAGMRERVALLGGSLRAGPCDGGGFALEICLPRQFEELFQ